MISKNFVFFVALLNMSLVFAQQEIPIPRTSADKGKYFLLETKRRGGIVTAVHKRVGVDSVGFTKTEINCETMMMRQIGYTEDSLVTMPTSPTPWFSLVPGSSKSDLAQFVCKR